MNRQSKNERDHTRLICDIGELSSLFTDSTNLETFLQGIVEMIAEHMKSDVCSVYLYYDDTQELELRATKGLNPSLIGNVKLKLGEGLTGLALKELRPICERHASKNTSFRYFPDLGEEQYESFLAVPISRGRTMIGTMVIQNAERNYFSEEDIIVLRAITSQLATTIEMARLILSLEGQHEFKKTSVVTTDLKLVKAMCGAGGCAHAESIVFGGDVDFNDYVNDADKKVYSVEEFHKALAVTESQLENFQESIEQKLSDVASLIFSAQILMLKDQGFVDAIDQLIGQGINPPEAVIRVVKNYVKRFEQIENPYLREKSHDVRDIGRRLLENLIGSKDGGHDVAERIVIAKELLPSDALKLSSQNVKGIIVLRGGSTGHLAILAQSLQIPLVIADEPGLLHLPKEAKILMDADQGNIYIDPDEGILKTFKNKEDAKTISTQLKATVADATHTLDGTKITLMANVNLLGDLDNARDFKAEGIGLYRTEFPFIIRANFPSEEEQFIVYKKLVDAMPDQPITFRTLDIGGDKVLSYMADFMKEDNPFLGLRSIRFSLEHTEIFQQQVRAIVRAAYGTDLRLMFPMISSVDEFLKARDVVYTCIDELKQQKIVCHQKPRIGMMVELPSVLEVIDELVQEVDFLSIGTNDFIQYMLAVDRTNAKVAQFYIPHHPSVLRALHKIVECAMKNNKDVSICGDMAHEEKYLEFLLGIGIRNLSVNPVHIPKLQDAIGQIDIKQAQNFATEVLKKSKLEEINPLFK